MPKAAATQNAPKPRQRKANGYKFPEKLPKGEILKDVTKREWILGESIGQGGFGEIYCAADASAPSKWTYVIKIEPHENGPLFMEKNFYIKVAKPDDIEAWKGKEGIKILGMPTFYGSGTHFCNNVKYRFLVMERYGKDVWSHYLAAKSFRPETVYRCALQIMDALRYIHSKDYVHGDIKGANLLLGLKPGTENHVYLVDFGLACKYSQKEFQKDPKQAHNGTIEYTSCDWHLGVPTRRGDLEILGYNLLHWLSGSLPWEKDISNKETVHKKKQELMQDVDSYIKKHFPKVPKVITSYMSYVSKLKHDEEPNYKYCKDLFTKEMKLLGAALTGPLEFKPEKSPTKKRTSMRTKVQSEDEDNENEVPTKKAKTVRKPRAAKPKVEVPFDNGDQSEESEVEIKPAPVKAKGRKPRGAAAAMSNDPSQDEPVAPKTTKRGKTADPAKPSWKDAPTVQGNLSNRAGEYKRRGKP